MPHTIAHAGTHDTDGIATDNADKALVDMLDRIGTHVAFYHGRLPLSAVHT